MSDSLSAHYNTYAPCGIFSKGVYSTIESQHTDEVCGVCEDREQFTHSAFREDCMNWFHLRCLGLTDDFASEMPEGVPLFVKNA